MKQISEIDIIFATEFDTHFNFSSMSTATTVIEKKE